LQKIKYETKGVKKTEMCVYELLYFVQFIIYYSSHDMLECFTWAACRFYWKNV